MVNVISSIYFTLCQTLICGIYDKLYIGRRIPLRSWKHQQKSSSEKWFIGQEQYWRGNAN